MLTGDLVSLCPITRADVPQLWEWDNDYATWPDWSTRPYLPKTLDEALRSWDAGGVSDYLVGSASVPFAITVADVLVGSISLWGIDLHNRRAHLGINLGPESRGRGFGTDACRVLLRYAFVDRGLRRVQLEVLADNVAAVRAYQKAGFVEEGRTRDSALVRGEFVDELVMAVLAHEPR